MLPAIPAARRPVRPAWPVLWGLLVLLTGCHAERRPASPAAGPPVAVRTVRVDARPRPAFEEVAGTVRSRWRTVVEARWAGRIESLPVVPGQRVAAGEVLLVLEAREVQARLEQAVAVRDQAARDLERLERLTRDGAATAAELDAARARHQVAVAAVTEARTLLGQARVVAPFPGVVTRKFADLGDLAAPGRPLLEIEDPAVLRLEADVPEALMERVEMGLRLPVTVPAVKEPLDGVVSEIAPAAESVSRTFLVKLDLPPRPGLRPGQFGRVSLPTEETRLPQVPALAVRVRGQLELVYVVREGRAWLRLIRTGRQSSEVVAVLAGLEAGEEVVTDGADRLSDGQPVEVLP